VIRLKGGSDGEGIGYFLLDSFHFAGGVFVGGPVSEKAVVGIARDDVEMHMFDELSGAGVVVVEDVVAWGIDGGNYGLGDGAEAGCKSGGQVGGAVFQSGVMFFGYQEAMAGAEGADIKEGKDLVIFENFSTRNVSFDNLAKYALIRHSQNP